jgi:mono/diheme cytochrome c family protein|tara:strand:+ start:2591 stop:3016 length:426 start_codon:yes stop_codon:yes gene_type:complete
VEATTVMQKLMVAAVGVFLGSVLLTAAQDQVQEIWEVPEEERAVENPIASDDDVLAEGQRLYERNCRMCHGETGLGDGPATARIKPAPRDITTADAQDRMTDGEMFYKITVGKRPMREFESRLTEDERWSVVHYLRTLRAG